MTASPISDWLDRQAGRIFLMPAVVVILAFSIFPLLVSAWLSFTRFQLGSGGYELKFIGILNFKKMFAGSQQFHLLGTAAPLSPLAWLILLILVGLVGWAMLRAARASAAPVAAGLVMLAVAALGAALLSPFGPLKGLFDAVWTRLPAGGWAIVFAAIPLVWLVLHAALRRAFGLRLGAAGFLGRMLAATIALTMTFLFTGTIGEKGQLGSLSTTLFYVIGGVTLQFLIGLGLAWLCAREIRGRNLFRVLFFIPLMVTPVGIAYTFRMLADTNVGPFAPLFQALGIGAVEWATNAWSARAVIMMGDTWQWVPFIFIVMLAAIESQPRDQVEAAELDGASGWQIFRDITWPSIAPVAATVILIRVIEAFKIVDLPNVLTNGGPGISTESLTLHSFIEWRTLNLGGSAAVAYVLLFVATIACVSFFNFVVRPARGEAR